jgi:uncharacterized protein YggT (Ycf19 family)
VLSGLLDFYELLIIAYVIFSWFPMRPDGLLADIYRVLASVCEPYVGVFRRIVPTVSMGGAGIDFSPIVALLVLRLLIEPALLSLIRMTGL